MEVNSKNQPQFVTCEFSGNLKFVGNNGFYQAEKQGDNFVLSVIGFFTKERLDDKIFNAWEQLVAHVRNLENRNNNCEN